MVTKSDKRKKKWKGVELHLAHLYILIEHLHTARHIVTGEIKATCNPPFCVLITFWNSIVADIVLALLFWQACQ